MSDDLMQPIYEMQQNHRANRGAAEEIDAIDQVANHIEAQAAEITRLRAERDALQARVAELEGALDAAGRVLHKAGEQFSEYAKQHAAKGTAVSDLKAAANKQWAERCFSAYWRAVEGGGNE